MTMENSNANLNEITFKVNKETHERFRITINKLKKKYGINKYHEIFIGMLHDTVFHTLRMKQNKDLFLTEILTKGLEVQGPCIIKLIPTTSSEETLQKEGEILDRLNTFASTITSITAANGFLADTLEIIEHALLLEIEYDESELLVKVNHHKVKFEDVYQLINTAQDLMNMLNQSSLDVKGCIEFDLKIAIKKLLEKASERLMEESEKV